MPATEMKASRNNRLEYLMTMFLERATAGEGRALQRTLEKWFKSGRPAEETDYRDLLMRPYWGIEENERDDAQQKLANYIHDTIADLSAVYIQDVARFVDICRNARGCESPAEEFIIGLVQQHYDGGLTPEHVRKELDPDNSDGFQLNFTELQTTIAHHHAIYGQRVISPAATLPRPDSAK